MSQGALCSTLQEIREVGIDDFPVFAKQQFFDLDRRLLGDPGPAGRRIVRVKGRLQRSVPAPSA
jgi:hypothetical protein